MLLEDKLPASQQGAVSLLAFYPSQEPEQQGKHHYQRQGLSIIPLKLYIFKGRAKLEIGLCKGKKLYDKRAVQAKKDSDRAIERAMKGNY